MNTTVQERLLTQLLALQEKKPIWSIVSFFTPKDFDDATKMHPFLIVMLDNIRWRATQLAGQDVKMVITSDARPGDDKSTHGETPCLGVDVRARESRDRYFLIKAALELGITRIGVYCDDLHVHFDVGDFIKPDKYPTQVMWVRKCGSDE